jgi:hypothetical protein
MKISRTFRNFASRSMNSPLKLNLPLIRTIGIGLLIANSTGAPLIAAGTDLSLRSQISSSSAFYQPLFCISSRPPSDSDTQELWAEIQKINVRGAGPSIGFL